MNRDQQALWDRVQAANGQPVLVEMKAIYPVRRDGTASWTPKWEGRRERNAMESMLEQKPNSTYTPGGYKRIPCLKIVEEEKSDRVFHDDRPGEWRIIAERFWVVGL